MLRSIGWHVKMGEYSSTHAQCTVRTQIVLFLVTNTELLGNLVFLQKFSWRFYQFLQHTCSYRFTESKPNHSLQIETFAMISCETFEWNCWLLIMILSFWILCSLSFCLFDIRLCTYFFTFYLPQLLHLFKSEWTHWKLWKVSRFFILIFSSRVTR